MVGAKTDNALGVASYCWGCSVMPVKVLAADGSGSVGNVASALIWAADHGARVACMSLGTATNSSTLQNAVTYAKNLGMVMVAAAGNAGAATTTYPAGYADVIGVAATDGNDAKYVWSNYGSWVDVSAPGANISTGMNGWYGVFSGTSSAALLALGGPVDTTPPSVTWVSPAVGSTVSGTVNVEATVTDDTGVSKVKFYVDGLLAATSSTAPYTFKWSLRKGTAGAHLLQEKAYDAAGNVGVSAQVSVTKK